MPPRGDGTYVNRSKKAAPDQFYLRISRGPQRGKYVHTLVAEAKIGRALFSFETVHHVDGNHLNNDPGNLEVVKRDDHANIDNARRRAAYEERVAGLSLGQTLRTLPPHEIGESQ